jgi:DNA (cytosine-5)-methyltransferase 1
MSGIEKRGAYYNENDPFAAAWLRELIKAGHIAPGIVDERSIEDVLPNDLAGFVQCHFFAGIGVWSHALRRAGWPDDRPVWTGSAPCQPFSSSGQKKGFADKRHLWPAFYHLISQCRPDVIFGEQVASKDGLAWLDLVSSDLENAGYACGAVDTPACGFGAPHIRQRLYWVADAEMRRHKPFENFKAAGVQPETIREAGPVNGFSDICPASVRLADSVPAGRPAWRAEPGDGPAAGGGGADGMENSIGLRSGGRDDGLPQSDSGKPVSEDQTPGSEPIGGLGHSRVSGLPICERASLERPRGRGERGAVEQSGCTFSGLEYPNEQRRERREAAPPGNLNDWPAPQRPESEHGAGLASAYRIPEHGPGPTDGQWEDADWLLCRDGKWRPVEPGTFPLAHGAPNRVGRLRGYGNAIVAPQAEAFIRAYMTVGEAKS